MQRGSKQRGFTLVEVGITVAILALVAAVVIPGLNNMTRADLRKATSGVSITIRSAFDDAALSGNTYRLVFEPGKPIIKVQSTEETLTFDAKDGAFVAASKAEEELSAMGEFPGDGSVPDDSDKKGKKKKDAKPKDDKKKKEKEKEKQKEEDSSVAGGLSALFNINKLGAKSANSGFADKSKYDMGENVHIMDVWTDGMDDVATEGEVYIYFFPNGYTQEALIHLEDKEKRTFTIKLAPLTGKCSVEDRYLEVPK